MVSRRPSVRDDAAIDAALAAQITLLAGTDKRDATTIERLATRRDLALVRVSELRAAQEARSIVEGRYLDGHGALFPDAVQAWTEQIRSSEPSPTRWSAWSNSTVCPLQLRATPRPCPAGPPSLWPTLWSRPRPPHSTSSTRVSGRSASLPGGYGRRSTESPAGPERRHDDSIVTGATTDDRGRGTHSGAVDSVT